MQVKSKLQLKKQIQQARGLEPADCVLKNCRVIDVFCAQVKTVDIALCGEIIVGLGDYSGDFEYDCQGSYVSPGFMEGHIHIESSMLSPRQFSEIVLPHGTTTVVCDPHEIANVAGLSGVKYLLDESKNLECSIYVMAPSCVPATHLENGGAAMGAADIAELLHLDRVLGIAEMMNFPGVLFQDDEVMEKLLLASRLNVPVDGHAPGLTGRDLQAYISSGIMSDHECTTITEAREKLSSGMFLFIREGSTAKNLEDLLPAVTERNSHRCLLVTDDCHPEELLQKGHLDRILRKAIRLGLDPVTAIQMVTINVANYFSLAGRGGVAPGYIADLVVFDDLLDIRPRAVFAHGKLLGQSRDVAESDTNKLAAHYPTVFDSVHVNSDTLSLAIPAEGEIARVIRIKKNQLITEAVEVPVTIQDGMAVADVNKDLVKLAVIERHQATGNTGLGFVQGIGLKQGALASTVSHDSHNIIAVGVDDRDMELVVQAIIKQGGGLAVVCNGEVKARLVLDIAGLMSTADARKVAKNFSALLKAAQEQGVSVSDPFMLMSFLALPVIPHLKMTDLGLVDVDTFSHTSLWV